MKAIIKQNHLGSGGFYFFLSSVLKHYCFKWFAFIGISFAVSNSYAAVNFYDKEVDHPPIPFLDELGKHVLESNNPYSPKKTCEGSGCHDYDAITHAYHFEMGRDEADDRYGEKRGLPQLVSPGYYGGYSCMDGSNPQVLAKKNNASPVNFADYGSAGWVKTCMDCHTGGGWAEKDRDGIRYDQKDIASIKPFDGDYYERVKNPQTGEETLALWDWKKSGVGEADCLICHLDFGQLRRPNDSGLNEDLPPRKARKAMIEKGFFRQAASGLLEYVRSSNGKHLVSIARTDGLFTLDEKYGLPIFNWHEDAFDKNGRTTIKMLRFPGTDNCMACHLTSNTRRGFYGFGEEAAATLATDGGDEEMGAGGTIEDDYRDDVHKGTRFTEDNGEQRAIENCNACHSKQYYKPKFDNVDLDADHNFPKGNSDMDVRNDLDYKPNVQSCEKCHIYAKNAVVQTKYSSLLESHTEAWKARGYLKGYDDSALSKITQTHFDVVACQTCHIVNKETDDGETFQMMYRFRTAEDGKRKIIPYNPRLRYYWKDLNSGRVLVQSERNAIFAQQDANNANIVDPISQEVLGRVSIEENGTFSDPSSYESFVAVKKAYDSLLLAKGYRHPNTSMIWTESNEYVISHNTRAAKDSMPCADCHVREADGKISQKISVSGTLGSGNSKMVTSIPDTRLVKEGIVTLDLAYNKLQDNGDITQNVADILNETKADPFMSLLKNSSADEVTGRFTKIPTANLLKVAGDKLGALLAPDFLGTNSFVFALNKGALSLRSMILAISGSAVGDILLPTFRLKLGMLAESSIITAQNILRARRYGALRSRVFYFDLVDSNNQPIGGFNGGTMVMKVPYKGVQTDLDKINIVMADSSATRIYTLSRSDLLMIEPANDLDDGYILFKMRESGYFLVADK